LAAALRLYGGALADFNIFHGLRTALGCAILER
jgi:hypothetical protein